ncbi:hypothetical protein EON65_16110 [archaeon]|nr:MAG: hypothetical protein EON65_16110 [archaeon]
MTMCLYLYAYPVKFLLDRANTIQKCEKALQQAYDSFKQGFEGYYESERASIKALAGRTFNNDGHSVLQAAELVSTTGKGLLDLWAAKVCDVCGFMHINICMHVCYPNILCMFLCGFMLHFSLHYILLYVCI